MTNSVGSVGAGLAILTLAFLAVPIAFAEDPTTSRSFVPAPAQAPSAPADPNSASGADFVKLPNTVKELQSLADRGNMLAALRLGDAYLRGAGIPRDYAKALILLRKAADAGSHVAQSEVGYLYDKGFGVPQDYSAALDWYRKAAAQGDAMAENNLGAMYQRGAGVPVDYAEAMRHFHASVDLGNPYALVNLASSYQNGHGAPRDELLAYFYYALAAARLPATTNGPAVASRDAVARRLPPAEIEQAQEAARNWKPGTKVALKNKVDSAGAPSDRPAKAFGTGFAITDAGHLLTNNHVIQSCTNLRIRREGEAALAAEVIARDPQNDLALLKTPGPLHDLVAFREGRAIRQGDGVVAYGFPLTGALATDGALTTGTVSALAGLGNDTRFLQISAPVQPGNSGGPLIDDSGNLVGVVNAKLNALMTAAVTGDIPQNVNFAIKASVARDFLDANGVNYQTAKSTRDLKPADLAERARRFTFLVECR
jgi:uncharacterized protein